MAGRRALAGAQLWWGIGAIVASLAIATAAAWPIYQTPRLAIVAVSGLVIGTGSVLLGRALGWRWWSTALAAVGAYLVLVVPVAIPGALGGELARVARGLVDGVLGVALGWKQLLTVSIPAGDYQAVLVPFLFLVAVCTLAATALVVAGGRWAPFAAIPMLAMTAFGEVFGSAELGADLVLGPITIPAPAHVVIALLAVGIVVVWLVGRARIARSEAVRAARAQASTVRSSSESFAVLARRRVLAAALVVVALAAGLLAAPVADAFGERQALRDEVDPELLIQQQPSPLSGYRGWFTADAFDAELFRVTAPESVDRVRIATLDEYDGQTFRVGDADDERFSRVPRTASADAAVEIEIADGYRGVWVPVVAADGAAPLFSGSRAEALTDGFYADPERGSAVVVTSDADAGTGLVAGDAYRVDAVATAGAAEGFADARGDAALIDVEAYPALDAWVELQDLPRTGAGLAELVERLSARGYLSHAAADDEDAAEWIAALEAREPYAFQPTRSGHSTGRVEELFTSLLDQERRAGEDAAPELLVAAVGDDEQFATAAAVLARHQGFESRVVVGVRLGDADDSAVLPCDVACTGANVTAWVEVRAAGGAWATLDVTPQFALAPQIIREGEVPPQNPTVPELPASEALDPPAAESDDASSTSAEEQESSDWWADILPVVLAVATGVAMVALLVLPFLVFPVAKLARRRWRRSAAEPEVAMVGAWNELLDGYTDFGIDVPRGLTRTETADAVARPAAVALAELVDRAVFAEHAPDAAAGREGWRIVDEERREVRGGTRFWARIRAVLTPASLVQDVRAADMIPEPLSRLRRKDPR